MAANPAPKAMRQAYGETLADLGRSHPELVVFDADVSSSSRSAVFAEAFPDRFFNIGIAEANMAAMAAGMATTGWIPFVNTFAAFMVLRAADPVRSLIAYTDLNVKLAGTYAGLSDSYDGASHHSIADIAFMRAMPNMVILSPCDNQEAIRATRAALAHRGPVYLRIHRNEVPDIKAADSGEFRIGQGCLLREGEDLTLISTGYMTHKSLLAADIMARKGIRARVVNIHTIKPIDSALILRCAEETGLVVTVEEHSIHGGLGGAVAEVLGKNRPTPMRIIGVNDVFAESGDYEQLLAKHGLSAEKIASAAEEALRKERCE